MNCTECGEKIEGQVWYYPGSPLIDQPPLSSCCATCYSKLTNRAMGALHKLSSHEYPLVFRDSVDYAKAKVVLRLIEQLEGK